MNIPHDDGYTAAVVVNVGGILVCGAIMVGLVAKYLLAEWRKTQPPKSQPLSQLIKKG
jgi:hypothetical protein